MKQEVEQVKKFQFFNQDQIQDVPVNNDPQAPTLNDIGITDGVGIGSKLFLFSQAKNSIYVYEGNSIQGSFQPYNDQLRIIKASKETRDGVLVTFGIDVDGQMKSSYVKFWDVSSNDYTNLKPKKVILINKAGQPLQQLGCFCVSKDLSAMAFGLQDGSVLAFKSKNLMTSDFKDSYSQADQEAIRSIQIARVDQNVNMYCTTDSNIVCFQNMQNRKRFNVPGGALFDLTSKGTLIGCPKDDNQIIVEFDDTKKVNQYNLEGEKFEIKAFKSQYLIILINPKNEKEADQVLFYIYDTLNQYIAFNKKFDKIQKFITAGDFIYLITQNKKGEKQLQRLSEKENTHKIETFFKNNQFDTMYKFASNQSSDKGLLAEISRLHGDFLYDRHDFQASIKQYINTAGYLEPSYVIGKFLDVSHVDYLIQYLAELHLQRLADKNHTALLLNCYVKQKQISKLEEFLKESSFDSDLFDIETAIRECRQLKNTDLALKLAESRKHNEFYLRILIEDMHDCKNALIYIRDKIQLDEKAQYLKEFGQQLMKSEPDMCLDIIEKLVLLTSMVTNIKKKGDTSVKSLSVDDQKICQYFKLTDDVIEKITSITFGKPDEFLHLFVVNNEYLENYLVFLIRNCQNLPNEKTIFHRYFEYHLEKYQQFYKADQKRDADILQKEQGIMSLLGEQENEKKYDKNHLLVLFKMYNFTPGIIFLLKKLQMREELLNFYIGLRDNDQIIQLCREFGKKEANLWIQALKYFAKPENSSEDRINEVLSEISQLQHLSPLLILNILAKNRNVNFKLVKSYFIEKIKKDRDTQDQKIVQEKMAKAAKIRSEYKKLKTQAKVCQQSKCSACENPMSLPSVHFLCEHSYHDQCIHVQYYTYKSENNQRSCPICRDDYQMFFKRQFEFKEAAKETKAFKEKLYERPDKFEVIGEYLGHGLINNEK